MAFKKPTRPKNLKLPKSKNPAIVLRGLNKQKDRVKDYEAKMKKFEADVKAVEKAKDELAKLKNKLSK